MTPDSPAAAAWAVEVCRGRAADLHRDSAAAVGSAQSLVTARLRVLDAYPPAVVLGSSEPEDHLDRDRLAARGWDMARRRSGGGAVVVGPDDVLWVDLVVPADSQGWSSDIRRAARWVGDRWLEALTDMGLEAAELDVWSEGMVTTEWSDRVCFAGMGPGEVRWRGRKLVGISQRRTRRGAVLQCAVLRRWAPEELVDVLRLDSDARCRAARDLATVATAMPDGIPAGRALVSALSRRLRAAGPAQSDVARR